MTTATITGNILEQKHCLGHEAHVRTCYNREDVRQESSNVLADFSKDVTILSSKTHMLETSEKKRFLGSRKVYDLFITYIHKDNTNACQHFNVEKITNINKKDELTKIEIETRNVFIDAKDNLSEITTEEADLFFDAIDRFEENFSS